MQNSGSRGAVGEKPPVVRQRVTIGAVCDVNIAVEKQQSRALQMLLGDEWHPAVYGNCRIRTWNRALNFYRAAEFFRSSCKAEGMKPVNNGPVFAGGNSHIQCAGQAINDGSAADADFRRDKSIGRLGNGCNSGRGIDKAALPEWRCGPAIGLKG